MPTAFPEQESTMLGQMPDQGFSLHSANCNKKSPDFQVQACC
jgi:hypothetical protein